MAAILIGFVAAEYPTRFSFLFGVSLNAAISVVSLALLALYTLVTRRTWLVGIPAAAWALSAWLTFRALETTVPVVAGQQLVVWWLFILTMIVSVHLVETFGSRMLVRIVVVSAVVWATVALFEGFAIRSIGLSAATIANRPTAAMLAVSLPIVLAGGTTRRARSWRWFLCAVILGGIAATGSRTATVAGLSIIASEAVLTLAVGVWKSSSSNASGALLRMLVWMAIAAGATWYVVGNTQAGQRIVDTVTRIDLILSDPGSVESNEITQGRSATWPELLRQAGTKPVLGHGLGASVPATYALTGRDGFSQPHNDFIRVLYETGLIGVLLLIAFLVSVSRMASKMDRVAVAAQSRPFGRVAVYALIVASLLMFTDNVVTYSFVMIPIALCIAVGTALPKVDPGALVSDAPSDADLLDPDYDLDRESGSA